MKNISKVVWAYYKHPYSKEKWLLLLWYLSARKKNWIFVVYNLLFVPNFRKLLDLNQVFCSFIHIKEKWSKVNNIKCD